MAFWPNDTLKDVAVVMEGYGTVEVKFTPSDGGVGTRMQVTSQSKYQGGTAGASAAPRAPQPLHHPTRDGEGPAAPNAPTAAGTHDTPIDVDQARPTAAAGTHDTPIDVDQADAPAAAGMHAPINVDQPDAPAPAAGTEQRDESESDSRGNTPSDDGVRDRTPSDYGDYAADGMVLLRSSQVQMVPIDGAPGYFKMLDPRVLALHGDHSDHSDGA
ncbi:hypothetical protein FA95DRAFT_1613641 [Auriscalpium vulgare]|uniref:Uncharacterized protein n=1 Tax=Auriscalpium vulgare TaxID=40419 RepID=A0ACB8R250_9AGAM|nr:hypothetical protein FA95DRAFT_1613641 [Auriscalpium vulgare]